MRKHGRLDANHREVVEALEAIGASVQSLANIGKGCPDLLVGYMNKNILIEVKDGNKPPSKRCLTPDQIEWRNKWKGARVFTAYSRQDAKNLFDVLFGGV